MLKHCSRERVITNPLDAATRSAQGQRLFVESTTDEVRVWEP